MTTSASTRVAHLWRLLRERQATLLVGSAVTLVMNGLALVFSVFASIVVARALGPSENGKIVWFLSGTTTVATFADFVGIYYANAYLLAGGKTGCDLSTTRGTVLAYGAVIGTFAGVALALSPLVSVLGFSGFDPVSGRALLAANVAGIALLTQARGQLWGEKKFILLGTLTFLRWAFFAVFALLVTYGLRWRIALDVAIAYVGSVWCTIAVIVFILRRDGISAPSLGYLRRSVGVGWRAMAVTTAGFLHLRADQYLVTHMLGAAALGLYGVAVSLGEVLTQIPSTIGSVLFGEVAADQDEVSSARRTTRRAGVTILLSAVFVMPLAIFAKPIIGTVYGASFLQAATLLLFFLPGTVALSGLVLFNAHFGARGYPFIQLVMAVAAVVLNVVSNVVLLPRLGVVGAPISNSVSSLAWLVAMVLTFLWLGRTRSGARSSKSPAEVG